MQTNDQLHFLIAEKYTKSVNIYKEIIFYFRTVFDSTIIENETKFKK